MLFSATQTTKTQDLARISLRPGTISIDVDKEAAAYAEENGIKIGLEGERRTVG